MEKKKSDWGCLWSSLVIIMLVSSFFAWIGIGFNVFFGSEKLLMPWFARVILGTILNPILWIFLIRMSNDD